MDKHYLTSFEDQTSALGYTSGDTTLVSPQVSLVGTDEVVYSKKIPNESRIRFAKDEATGRLYFVVDGVYYDIKCLEQRPIIETTYDYVDLGLSVKWANKNIGAKEPQDNGYYFSWGSTTPNAVCLVDGGVPQDELIKAYLYDNDGYSYDDMTPELIQGVKDQYGDNLESELKNYFNENYGDDTWGIISNYIFGWKNTPYCTVDEDSNAVFSKYNETDSLTVLEAMDDAATVIMGDEWRMPTSAETLELVQNTDHYYIGEDGSIVAGPFDYATSSSDKGLDGSKLRSICFVKKGEAFDYNNRSNFIEFPFAGYCFGSLLGNEGLYGYVWSSSVDESSVEDARGLGFSSDGYLDGDDYDGRFLGLSVRGVRA
jgi:hypothetical protein